MSFLRALGLRPKTSATALRAQLPVLNGFVEFAMPPNPILGSVAIDEIGPKTITTSTVPGLAPGTVGVFVYANSYGRFRFSAKCLAVKGNQATFELPKTIATLKRYDGAQKRATVRLDTTLPAAWRYVSLGKGNGEFARASLTDLSRTGLSLIIDRELTKGTQVEVRFTLNSASAPVLVLGEVVRASKIEKSGKVSHGLRFHGVGDAVDRAIMEFINKRQTERRNRGLA